MLYLLSLVWNFEQKKNMTNAKLKNNEDSLEIDEITNKMKRKEFKAILMKQSVC